MKHLLSMEIPAREWEEAYPIGNGRLGAMIMGEVKEEKIFLNEDSLWYGGEKDCHNPDTIHFLEEIRTLLFGGKIDEASKLAKYAMTSTPKYMNPYHPLGNIGISFDGLEGEVTDYRRTLNLDEAISSVSFVHGDTLYTREMFVSNPDQVIAMRFKAKGEGRLTFSVNMNRRPFEEETGKVMEHAIFMQGQSGPGGVRFYAALSGEVKEGRLRTIGDFVYVEQAREVILYFTAVTSFRGEDYKEKALTQNQAARHKGFKKIKEDHVKDYQTIYNKNQLCLSEDRSCATTDQLIEAAKNGKDAAHLAELFYAYGRYLLISSSREGTLPANLQGIWNNSFTPPWECNYTININTQMNYWPSYEGNLIECQEPLITFIRRLCKNGKQTARRLYGVEGSVAHHTTNMWAQTTPGGIMSASPFWPMGLAWLSLHLSEHYHFTQDETFLREVCLPILEEVGMFYKGYLVESPEGYLVTGPSLSPENSYKAESGEVGSLCMGPSMDTQIIRQVLQEYIALSKALGINESRCEQFNQILDRLAPISIGKYGQIMEWYKDYEEVEPGHRHMSHLFGLHPGSQMTKTHTPHLIEAAKITLARRLEHGGGHTSWSMAWIVNHYARLLEGEQAYKQLKELMTKQIRCNLFTVHPPFQIDGNLGGCAGIAQMLIQSHEGFIRLLPAVPKAWAKGSAKGFLARGGIQVDFDWEQGQVCTINVVSVKDTTCKIVLPNGKMIKVELEARKAHMICCES